MLETVFIVGFGAFVQEAMWWYGLRRNLDKPRYKALMSSPRYYFAVAMFICIAMGVGWIWHHGRTIAPQEALVFGLGMPVFLKALIDNKSTANQDSSPPLGDGASLPLGDDDIFTDYLRRGR